MILLNKVDLCTKEHIAKVKEAISKLNKKATILETHKSEVDLKLVINTGMFDCEQMMMDQKGLNREEEEDERGPEQVITSFVY